LEWRRKEKMLAGRRGGGDDVIESPRVYPLNGGNKKKPAV